MLTLWAAIAGSSSFECEGPREAPANTWLTASTMVLESCSIFESWNLNRDHWDFTSPAPLPVLSLFPDDKCTMSGWLTPATMPYVT